MVARLIFILMLIATDAYAANYFVATTGNDTTGNGSSGNPWLTIQKCVNTAVAGDSCNVGAGTFYERVNAVNSGTSGNPITIKGDRTGGTWNTIVDGSEDPGGSWTNASATCSGCWSKNLGYEPVAMTFDGTKHAYRIHTKYMSGVGTDYNQGWTGQEWLGHPASYTLSPYWCSSYPAPYWDALGGALFGYDNRNGLTYVRFKDGEDPSTRSVRFARSQYSISIESRFMGSVDPQPGPGNIDGVFEINGKSDLIIRDFAIRGHWNGVVIYGSSGSPARRNIIQNNRITNLIPKVSIAAYADNTIVRNNELETVGGWTYAVLPHEGNCDTEQRAKSAWHYNVGKGGADVGGEEQATGVLVNACPIFQCGGFESLISNTEITGNLIKNGVVGIRAGGRNTKIHANEIRNHASQAIWPSGDTEMEFYDNLVVEANNFTRLHSYQTSGAAGYLYFYRNKGWNDVSSGDPEAAGFSAVYADGSGSTAGNARIYFYHNSLSGWLWPIAFTTYSSCNDCLIINNVFSWNEYVWWENEPDTCSGVFTIAYNVIKKFQDCSNFTNNISNNRIWNITQTEPATWDLPAGHPARNAGINISASFLINGVSHPALRGFSPGYFTGAAPHMGAVQEGGVPPPPACTPDLVASYSADGNASDLTGTNHGSLGSGVTYVAGRYGQAWQLTGAGGITIPDASVLDFSDGFSLGAWVKPTTISVPAAIVYKNVSYWLFASGGGFGFCGINSVIGGYTFSGSDFAACHGTPLVVDQWTYLEISYLPPTLTLRKDGVEVSTASASDILTNTTGTLQFGTNQFNESFTGLIDNVRLYDCGISLAQHITDMNTALGVGVNPPMVLKVGTGTKKVGPSVTEKVGLLP